MPYSDEELEALYGGAPMVDQSPQAPPEVPWKRTKQIANILPEIGNRLFSSSVALLGRDATPEDVKAAAEVIPTFDTGPTTGIGDVVLDEVVPEIGTWVVPYLGATKAGRAIAGAGRGAAILTEALAQGGANYITANRGAMIQDAERHMTTKGGMAESPTIQPLASGILGAESGALQMMLPRWQRALPLAAVSALHYGQTGNAWEAGGNFVGNLLPGAWKATESMTAPVFNPSKLQELADTLRPFRPELNGELPPAPVSDLSRHAEHIPGTPFESPKLDGEFKFIDDVSTAPKTTVDPISDAQDVSEQLKQLWLKGDLGEAKEAELVKIFKDIQDELPPAYRDTLPERPLRLRKEVQPEFQFEYGEPPTGLKVDHFPREVTPDTVVVDTPDTTGMRLEGHFPAREQMEFPIIKLQGEGQLNPLAPGFQLVDNLAPANRTPESLELFDWRNQAVNAKPPLMLEAPKPAAAGEVAPKVSSSVEPPPAEPLKAVKDKEFSTNGLYHINLPNGKTRSIFRDPESRNWYFHEQHPDGSWKLASTGNKKEALAKAAKDFAEAEKAIQAPAPVVSAAEKAVEPLPADLPLVMTHTGEFLDIKPRMDGPHIISTILDEGDGNFLATTNWKAPHQNGPDSIFTQNIETATGLGQSGYLVRDLEGRIRITTDRKEALQIAKKSGQTAKVDGELHSQDLIEPVKPVDVPPTPKQVRVEEVNRQIDEMAAVETQLRAAVDTAKAKGDGLGLRIATRKLNEFLEKANPEELVAKRAAIDSKYGKGGASDLADPKLSKQGKDSIRRFQSRYSNESGFIAPETAIVLAAAGVGGLVAYNRTKGDVGSTIATAAVLAGLGLLGAKGMKNLRLAVGPEAKVTKVKVPGESVVDKVRALATDTAVTPGGFAVFGRGGIQANAVRLAEGLAGLNGTPLFRDAKILADGFVAHQLDELSSALQAARPYKPTPGFSDAAARFLRGQLVDKPTVTAAIASGGGVDSTGWAKLDAASRKAFPEKWMVVDNPSITNTSGPGVEVYHVSNATKARLLKMQKDSLDALATAPEDKEFMRFVLKSRDVVDTLMQVVHNAVPPGATQNKILGTMGQYMTRSHALLTDPKYYPTEVEISRAMDRLASIKEDRFLAQHASNASAPGSVPITHKGKTFYVTPSAADDWKSLYSPESLRSLVSQYIHEIKQIAAGKVDGIIPKDTEQLGTSLFARRQELDEVTQALLGTHEAPTKLIQETVNKLIPTARSAHFMQDLIRMPDTRTGLRMGYESEIAYTKAVNDIKDKLRLATDPATKRELTTRLQELSSYIPVSGQDPRMGIFQGSYVSRAAHDQLAGFTSPFGLLDNSVINGLGTFNGYLKRFHLTANPVHHARNFVQIPLMLAIGNAADSPGAWKTAYEAIRNPTSAVGQRLTKNGVFSGNIVHGELNNSLEEFLDGTVDRTLMEKLFSVNSAETTVLGDIKKGNIMAAMAKIQKTPDDFVRASVYLAAEQRAAKKFGVSVDDADPRVMAEARQFMSERTIDHANLPQMVKTGRNIPFVSLYLSYAYEIARITGNLGKAALSGDLKAGATLGGIMALPFVAQTMAESALSPEDRKAWDQTQRIVQPYSRPRFKMPTSRNKDGSFNYIDLTPIMPLSDYQMAARAAANGDLEAAATVNPIVGLEDSPLLSVIAEQITGKEMHSGKEFRGFSDRARAIASDILPPHTPGLGREWIKAMPEQAGGLLGVTNLRNARTNSIEGALSRHLIGMDYTQVHPDIATRNFVAAAKREIANERQYLLDAVKAEGLSADAKKRAQDKFVEAVNHITQNLYLRLQLEPPK